jgi:hypothetical protein
MKMVYIPKNPQKLKKTAASKYRNKRITTQGITFDSIGERDRWLFLRDAESRGEIYNLRRQVKFELVVNHVKICDYIADFGYFKPYTNGLGSGVQDVIEDFKGVQTDVFKLKRKLMIACHGIEIRIVKTPTCKI